MTVIGLGVEGPGMDAGLEAELPPLQRLALAYAPAGSKTATLALLALDSRLAAIVRRRGETVLAQMRLAWWRDTLAAPVQRWPVGDPLLELLRDWREPSRLVALVDGWEQLLGESLDRSGIAAFAAGRAEGFCALAERVGAGSIGVVPAATTWALADLAANLSNPAERALVVETGAGVSAGLPIERPLRPLAILAGLGDRALKRGGIPLLDGRRATLLVLRLGLFGS